MNKTNNKTHADQDNTMLVTKRKGIVTEKGGQIYVEGRLLDSGC